MLRKRVSCRTKYAWEAGLGWQAAGYGQREDVQVSNANEGVRHEGRERWVPDHQE